MACNEKHAIEEDEGQEHNKPLEMHLKGQRKSFHFLTKKESMQRQANV